MATRRLSAAAERTPVAISPHLPPPARPSARPRSIHSSTSNISPLAPVLRWRAAVRPAPLGLASTPAAPPITSVTSRAGRPARVESLKFTWNHRHGSSACRMLLLGGLFGRRLQLCSSALRLRIEEPSSAAGRWGVFSHVKRSNQ
jgi:hypothetical protein